MAILETLFSLNSNQKKKRNLSAKAGFKKERQSCILL